jgi:hypothetical protein
VRGDVHTNTVEGYYSIFKRGMKGVYQHCKEKHLHRYLSEFDFRYSNRIRLGVDDSERATRALKGIVGKRLTYRMPLTERPYGKSREKKSHEKRNLSFLTKSNPSGSLRPLGN